MMTIEIGDTTDWIDDNIFHAGKVLGNGIYWTPESSEAYLWMEGWRFETTVMPGSYPRWWSSPTNEEARRTCMQMAVDLAVPFYEAKIDLRRTHQYQWKRVL